MLSSERMFHGRLDRDKILQALRKIPKLGFPQISVTYFVW